MSTGGFGRDSTFEGGGEPLHRHLESGGGVREDRPTTQSGKTTGADQRSRIFAGETFDSCQLLKFKIDSMKFKYKYFRDG